MLVRISLRRWRAVKALYRDCQFVYQFEKPPKSRIASAISSLFSSRPSMLGLFFTLEGVLISEFHGDEKRLSELPELGEISELGIVDSCISSTTLARIALLPKLHYLSLAGSTVIDEHLSELEPMQKLDVLVLSGTRVSKLGVNQIAQVLRGCRVLYEEDY